VATAFPEECKKIAPRELQRWTNALRTYIRNHIRPPLRGVSPQNYPIEEKLLIARWPHWEVIQTLVHRIKDLERLIIAVRALERGKRPLPVDEAREYPFDRIWEDEGIELRRVGRYLRGKCPFHEDHHPSLVVYPESNRWHCFACAEGGDTIAFVMKLHGLNFKEAVTSLAGDRI
jgi:hypothetical protein